jgi:membrane-bound serine protease (ClpP class)
MRTKAVLVALILGFLTSAASAADTVVVVELKGALGVATAEHIINGIEHAEAIGAELVIIDMDTPGGLMTPMRDIIQAILNSSVPVATYVSPEGARADSAGTYILMASHIAAMAPTTHMGAATPVSLTGDGVTPEDVTEEDSGDEEQTEEDGSPEAEPQPGTSMERKVLNDAIAYIRGLAERHGRNADWAEEAVRDAATLTAREALEMIDGHEIEVAGETVTMETSSVVIEEFEASWRIKILSAVANPEIVLILGMIGLYGLMYEGWNPGAIIPGVVGIICLLLAVRQRHSGVRHLPDIRHLGRRFGRRLRDLAGRLCPQTASPRSRFGRGFDHRWGRRRHV